MVIIVTLQFGAYITIVIYNRKVLKYRPQVENVMPGNQFWREKYEISTQVEKRKHEGHRRI